MTGLCAICAESRPTRSVRIDGRAYDVCVPCDTESPRGGRYHFEGRPARRMDSAEMNTPGCYRMAGAAGTRSGRRCA